MDDDQIKAADASAEDTAETVETPEAVESPAQETKPEVDNAAKLTNDLNALKVKMSKLEKERNEYATFASAFEALNDAAAKDPKFALEANRKLLEAGKISQEKFDELSETLSDKKETKKTDEAPVKTEPALKLADPALEWARRKSLEERQTEESFIEQFETAHPDISESEKISPR